MSVQVNFTISDELMDWLVTTAAENYRTPEGQLLWVIREAATRYQPPRAVIRDPQAVRSLIRELQHLHVRSGQLSCRGIADQIRRNGVIQVSHTTVNTVLRGTYLPSLRVLEAIVTALDGDPGLFRSYWMRAHGGSPGSAPAG